jgi:Lon protease-like protein
VQQDGSRATHGGQLAAITQAVLRTVAAAPPGAPPTATATSELSTSIPLAVLGTFVFPTATAEFYIFEPRYRLLFGRLATSGAPFAIGPMSPSPPPPTTRVPTEAEAELKGKELEEQVEAPLGLATLAALEEHTLLPDGRLRIRVRGLRRFDFKEAAVLPASFGLWLVTPSRWLGGADEAAAAAAALGAARPPSPMPRETAEDEGADTRRLGPALVAQLEQAAQRQGWSLRELDEAAGSPPMHSDTQLSWWLASLLPAPPDVKRRWFVTEGASSRLKVIGDWMKDAL